MKNNSIYKVLLLTLFSLSLAAKVSFMEYRVKASKKTLSALKTDMSRLKTLSMLLNEKEYIRTSNDYLLGDNKNSFLKKGLDSPFVENIENELRALEENKGKLEILTSTTNNQCEEFKINLINLVNSSLRSSDIILTTSDNQIKSRELARLKLFGLTYSSLDELHDLSFDFYNWRNDCFCNSPDNRNLVTNILSSLQKLNYYFLGVNGSWDVFTLSSTFGVYAKQELDQALDDLIMATPLVIAGVALFELYFIPQVSAVMTKIGVPAATKTFLSISSKVAIYSTGAYLLYNGLKPLVESLLKMNKIENVAQTYKNIQMIIDQLPEDNYNLYKLLYKIEENEHINHVRSTPKKLKEKIIDKVLAAYNSELDALKNVNEKINFLESYINSRTTCNQ